MTFCSGSIAQVKHRTLDTLLLNQDSIVLDSNSIVPGTMILSGLDSGQYTVDWAAARLVVIDQDALPVQVSMKFQTFSFNFNTPAQNKATTLMTAPNRVYNPFRSPTASNTGALLDLGGLDKRGSISRGVIVGNNQNLSVNSALNMQLSGQLNERFQILAAIADNNSPIQPEGNTQQLQDFDQVYIQVFDPQHRITAGDFQSQYRQGYFMRFNKKLQGGRYQGNHVLSENDSTKLLRTSVSGAVSRGKFARKTIQGVEGNQGPYRLTGAENEVFIVVLSGTERVYIDGRLLTRGQEHDYVINYNTAELIFTAKTPITKDRRIVAEFQYADRNYARSMLHASTSYRANDVALDFAIYSEQDAKNQGLQQSLSETQKEVLRNVGDSLHQAIASSVDTTSQGAGFVTYLKHDTTYFDPVLNEDVTVNEILVQGQSNEGQLYRATFSRVGQGQGNYVPSSQLAAGTVYEWVAPVGGVPQGTHEPVVQLISPKMRQMAVLRAQKDIRKGISASAELAASQHDLNTFSGFDTGDDYGMAGKFNIGGSQEVTEEWTASAGIDYEYVHRNFAMIERFRGVEFDRDWNIRDVVIREDQHILGAGFGIDHQLGVGAKYEVKSFGAGSAFRGLQHGFGAVSQTDRIRGQFAGTYTKQQGEQIQANYYQHNSMVAIPIWKVVLGFKDDLESNLRFEPAGDTLKSSSFQFWEWEGSVSNPDSATNRHKLSYAQRTDRAKKQGDLGLATLAKMYGYEMAIRQFTQSELSFRINYRTLDIVDSAITSANAENTLLSRLEYNFRIWRGAVTSSTFYELGSGLESKRSFIYIETPPGQGTHIHVDYNDNGVQELDEFELAIQADQVASANYIKVFVPTDEYIRVYTNQFSQSLSLRPAAIWRNERGIKKIISHFSNQFSYAADRKNLQLPLLDQFNPFLFDVADTVLQSTNASLRNIFYFNQTHPVFGADFGFQQLTGQQLLTSGFEQRSLQKWTGGFRWNIQSMFSLESRGEQGLKSVGSNAGSLSNRNYDIAYWQVSPKLSLQPGSTWRITLHGEYKESENLLMTAQSGNERSIIRSAGASFTWSNPDKGNLRLQSTLFQISYRGNPLSPVAFELLSGLQPGINATWGASYQRTLANNLQISINYNGRQSEGLRMIHTGGVEARAFF